MKPFIITAFLAFGACTGPEGFEAKSGDWIGIETSFVFSGSGERRIYADDVLIVERDEDADGKPELVTVTELPQGSYVRAREIITEGFPNVTAGDAWSCADDAGNVFVSSNVPVGDIRIVRLGCSPNGVQEIVNQIDAIMAGK